MVGFNSTSPDRQDLTSCIEENPPNYSSLGSTEEFTTAPDRQHLTSCREENPSKYSSLGSTEEFKTLPRYQEINSAQVKPNMISLDKPEDK